MALYDIVSGTTAVASDVEQLVNIFNAKHDIGAINLSPQISSPSSGSFSLTSQSGSSLGVGAYNYQFTYVTGQYKSDGVTLVQTGETTVSSALSITTTSGNTTVLVTLPTSGNPTSAIAINIYRTSVGGSDYKLVSTVKTGSANYTDSTADASRGSQTPPSSNGTGTSFALLIPWTQVTYLNTFVDWDTSNIFYKGAYAKDVNNMGRLRGLVKTGTYGNNNAMFNLPASLRPSRTQEVICLAYNGSYGLADVEINANGNVTTVGTFFNGSTAAPTWLSLDGVQYPLV